MITPFYEPIIVARKPCEGSCIDNVLKYGVGGINIEGCRVGDEIISYFPTDLTQAHSNNFGTGAYMPKDTSKPAIEHSGRYPSNVILTYNDTDFDEVCGGMPETSSRGSEANYEYSTEKSIGYQWHNIKSGVHFDDSGSAARYFYNAQFSSRDDDIDQIIERTATMENQEEPKIKLFSKGEAFTLYQGSMLDMLDVIEPNSIDAIVTDPPYELNFMGKGWDNSGIAFQKETWERCFKVLKPGGYMLAFGGTRTFHRIACAIEDAGFEIRDTILWLYGSGFPKSMNIGLALDKKNGEAQNEWEGWGTALKPAYEPILVSRKPCEGSCVDNVMKYGTGGINIDECRIGTDVRTYKGMSSHKPEGAGTFRDDNWEPKDIEVTVNGRFPANVILTYDETDKQEVCGGMPETSSTEAVGIRRSTRNAEIVFNNNSCGLNNEKYDPDKVEGFNDSGNASRYFYTAKASSRDRDEGLEQFEPQRAGSMDAVVRDTMALGSASLKGESKEIQPKRNTHPTVKPTDLMQYLIRLVTPKGGTILDPFNGSGSTGKAAMWENRDRNADYKYIGIEITPEYLPISEARIKYATTVNEVAPAAEKKKVVGKQINLFDL